MKITKPTTRYPVRKEFSNSLTTARQRLGDGYFKDFQVNTSDCHLSIELLDKLHRSYKLVLRRFPDCCSVSFALRVPKTHAKNHQNHLKHWFYMLAKQMRLKPHNGKGVDGSDREGLVAMWAKTITDCGIVVFRVVLFFKPPPLDVETSFASIESSVKQRVLSTWEKSIRVSKNQYPTMMTFANGNIVLLKAGSIDYRYQVHKRMYHLSALASYPRKPGQALSESFGVLYSKKNTTKGERQPHKG